MFYNIIPLIIIIVSLVIIIVIVIRKFPSLAAVDTSSVIEIKEAEVKHRLLKDRLKRKILSIMERTKRITTPLWLWIKDVFSDLYKRTVELEKKYQKEKREEPLGETVDTKQKIRGLLNDAESLIDDEDYKEAEKKLIEIISLDKRNIEAYKRLAEIYFKQKQYGQSEEILRHLLRMDPENDSFYLQLGEIAQEKGNNELALEYFQKAIDLAPNHPKNLDHLLEIAIILGKQKIAKNTFKKLKEVNPENRKLEEFKEKIESIG